MKSNRRQFFQTIGAGAAGLSLATPLGLASCKSIEEKVKNDNDQVLFIGDDIAIAETSYGKVRGYILRDIYYFLGMPYGADTSGENRFMPPKKPKPWTDIYPALWWGNTAPQPMEKRYANKFEAFRDHWNYDDVSEDCLKINVFTPGYNDGKKRPVLLWMHGGNWTKGSGIEHDGYNGENLARLGDVVFCSFNHRIGPLGFSDLSEVGGEKYAASGNVGVMDLVAVLEWVRDNIENFGGDPENVTIMGQSGGGAKVCTTSALPSAKRLYSKAVVLSGARLELGEQEITKMAGAYILKEAGLQASQIDQLQQMPWKEYYELAQRAAEKLIVEKGITSISAREVYWPHVDGSFIPHNPYFPKASENAADKPMLICSAANEESLSWQDSSMENITFEEIKERLTTNIKSKSFTGLSKERANEMVDTYSKFYPDKKPVEIYSMLSSYRSRSVLLADSKSKQKPPVYLSVFDWQPPLFDNRLRAFHCVDICFWFYNTDLMLSHTGGGSRPRALSEKMAGSLLQFMKTGNPNGAGLPEWPNYSSELGEMMSLNDVCEVQNDPDREPRKSFPPYKGYRGF